MVEAKPPEVSGLPPALEEQVLQAMELDPEARRGAEIEGLCAAHPGHAAAIRGLVARLYSEVALTLGNSEPSLPEVPDRIGPYRVLEMLGRGAFGTVYAAQEHEPDRKVAIKVLQLGLDSPTDLREILARFSAERQALALLNHPGIAKVFGSGATASGQPYFVMEFVDGLPIATYCEQHRLDLTARLLLFQQVCEAVHHAHQRGLIYRDLSVNNVLVESHEGRPRAKVIDFGLVKSLTFKLTDKTLHSRRERIMGTPESMSPEQARSSGRDITVATDIYALGVMLYVLLTGTFPIPSARLRDVPRDELQHAIEEIEPEPPSARVRAFGAGGKTGKHGKTTKAGTDRGEADAMAHARRLSGDLDWITMKALRKARDERYASAADLAAEIDRYLRNEPVLAGPPTSWYRVRKYVRRHRRPLLVAGAIIGALSIGMVVALVQRNEANAQRVIAQEAERRATASEVEARKSNADFRRMADVKRLQDLLREADEDLWPALPEKLRLMTRWLDRVEDLRSRGQLHRDKLAALDAALKTPDLPAAELEELLWQHGTMHALLAGLVSLLDADSRKPTIASVRKRIGDAQRAATDLTTTYASEWVAAVKTIADRTQCPLYEGLQLGRQLGLVPLGRNEGTQLYEFWHPASGERPDWPAQKGKEQFGDATGLVFVLVPGGTFWMGAQEAGQNADPSARPNESPVHKVALEPFFLSKFEMTQGQWERFTGHNPSAYKPGEKPARVAPTLHNPVEQVSWRDCERVLWQMGLLLPTEEQWEYACRAGTTTVYSTGDDVASLRDSANIADEGSKAHFPAGLSTERGFNDRHAAHAPVGSFHPNPWGFCDMHGNVWEWCLDEISRDYSPGPRTADRGGARVLRGGSFRVWAQDARSAVRAQAPPASGQIVFGVRPARAITTR